MCSRKAFSRKRDAATARVGNLITTNGRLDLSPTVGGWLFHCDMRGWAESGMMTWTHLT